MSLSKAHSLHISLVHFSSYWLGWAPASRPMPQASLLVGIQVWPSSFSFPGSAADVGFCSFTAIKPAVLPATCGYSCHPWLTCHLWPHSCSLPAASCLPFSYHQGFSRTLPSPGQVRAPSWIGLYSVTSQLAARSQPLIFLSFNDFPTHSLLFLTEGPVLWVNHLAFQNSPVMSWCVCVCMGGGLAVSFTPWAFEVKIY